MTVNVVVKTRDFKENFRVNNVPLKYTVEQFQKHLLKFYNLTSDISNFTFLGNEEIISPRSFVGDLVTDEPSTVTVYAVGIQPKQFPKHENANNDNNQVKTSINNTQTKGDSNDQNESASINESKSQKMRSKHKEKPRIKEIDYDPLKETEQSHHHKKMLNRLIVVTIAFGVIFPLFFKDNHPGTTIDSANGGWSFNFKGMSIRAITPILFILFLIFFVIVPFFKTRVTDRMFEVLYEHIILMCKPNYNLDNYDGENNRKN